MIDKMIRKTVETVSNSRIKTLMAAVLFHIVYSFAFGMIIGGKNPLVFLYENNYKNAYMILMPLLASLPYLISGYLIILARSENKALKSKSNQLFFTTFLIIFLAYLLTYAVQSYFPFRDVYGFYLLINYPAASFIEAMDAQDYALNFLVVLSTIFPPLMTYIGGLIRIKTISKEDIDG